MVSLIVHYSLIGILIKVTIVILAKVLKFNIAVRVCLLGEEAPSPKRSSTTYP